MTGDERELRLAVRRRRDREWRARRAEGPARVPVGPMRDHVERLQAAGMSRADIAAASGVPVTTIHGALRKGALVHRDTVAAVLAVPVPAVPVSSHVRVSAVGAMRRLQALAAIGWTMTRLSRETGVAAGSLYTVLRTGRCSAPIWRAISDAYDAFWNRPPLPQGRGTARHITTAIERARAAGWAPPLAWDDDTIDDPKACPSGVRRRDGHWTVEDFEELLRQGETHEMACRRLRITWKAFERRIYRVGRNDLAPMAWARR